MSEECAISEMQRTYQLFLAQLLARFLCFALLLRRTRGQLEVCTEANELAKLGSIAHIPMHLFWCHIAQLNLNVFPLCSHAVSQMCVDRLCVDALVWSFFFEVSEHGVT